MVEEIIDCDIREKSVQSCVNFQYSQGSLMSSIHAQRSALIKKIIGYLEKQIPHHERELISKFVEAYYSIVPYEDLAEHSIMDSAGAVFSHWNLMYQRNPGESKIAVFNPSYEKDGWHSTHTIVDVSHDDMPFLVDSVRMEISRRNIPIYVIVHSGGIRLKRDKQNRIIKILDRADTDPASQVEATIHFEINRINDKEKLSNLAQDIQSILRDVSSAVKDWAKMSEEIKSAVENLKQNPPPLDKDEINESIAFLEWLNNDNFTFLGFREYELVGFGEDKGLKIIKNTELGVLSDTTRSLNYRAISDMTEEAQRVILSPQILIIAKTNTKSTVYRYSYTDYIGVKRFNKEGKMIGERRFIGLFTSAAYHSNPQTIPFLRHKVNKVIEYSNINPKSHAGKALLNILETFPRDDLFQANVTEIAEISMGILSIQDCNKIRLFVRRDVYNRYMSCLVYLPKD